MGTKIVNRYGEPYPTREVRPRMGFVEGELDAECSEPPTFQQPAFTMPAANRSSDGEDEPPFFRGKR